MTVAVLACAVIGAAACESSAPGRPATVGPLSAQRLSALVVAPPSPYAHVPDQEKSTGLMEVGNPRAGTIGSPLGTKDQLVASGFQRGWESLYRTPTADVAQVEVFEFATDAGARETVARVRGHVSPSYRTFTVARLADSVSQEGTSTEGRSVVAIAFAHGRFAVSVLVGGTKAGMGYHDLAVGLAERQLSAVS